MGRNQLPPFLIFDAAKTTAILVYNIIISTIFKIYAFILSYSTALFD